MIYFINDLVMLSSNSSCKIWSWRHKSKYCFVHSLLCRLSPRLWNPCFLLLIVETLSLLLVVYNACNVFSLKWGIWSDCLDVVTAAGVPDMPSPPEAHCKSPHVAVVSWTEPPCNGSPVTDYHLEWKMRDEQDFMPVSDLYLQCLLILLFC